VEDEMKLAFSTLACPGWSVPQVIEAARRYGYDGVELRLIGGDVIDPALPGPERDRIRKLFEAAALPVVCVDTSIRLAAPADRPAAEADLLAFIDMAHEWHAPLVRVFGGPWPPEHPQNEVFDGVAASLSRVAPAAERRGVAVVMETHDAFASAATVAEVLQRVSSPAIGALWDFHHPYRLGESPEHVMDTLGDRVLYVHVKDARRRADGWDLVLVGEGEVPVAQSLEVLRRRGYAGWVGVEWEKKWHPEIPGPEVALPQHLAWFRSLKRAGERGRDG
jgi:sugar phosphate isomerase/epimerase